jgi:hypothetical protein
MKALRITVLNPTIDRDADRTEEAKSAMAFTPYVALN